MLTGSLETFTSSEVLRLVAGTRKTGSLIVRGAGPIGADIAVGVVVRDGEIVSASGGSSLATSTHTALADLLRISQGEFSFDADIDSAHPGASTLDVDEAIAAAESILAEWQILESYVPTLDVVVELTASVDRPITVHPSQWTTLSAIGAGCTVRDLSRLTGEGPLDVCRSIRSLVDLGVVRVHAAEGVSSHDETPADAHHSSIDRALSAVADLPAEAEWEAVPTSVAMRADSPMGPDSADLMPEPDEDVPVVEERFRHFSPRAAVAMAATTATSA